jgi:hypothetical protein
MPDLQLYYRAIVIKTAWYLGWWCTPLIPALGRQRQVDFWVRGQPGIQSEFQDSQGYTEKPCFKKAKEQQNKKKKNEKTNKQTNKQKPSWYWYRDRQTGRQTMELN